jgi:hypothetical protein
VYAFSSSPGTIRILHDRANHELMRVYIRWTSICQELKNPVFADMLREFIRQVQRVCHWLVLSNFALINSGVYARRTTVQETRVSSLITRVT